MKKTIVTLIAIFASLTCFAQSNAELKTQLESLGQLNSAQWAKIEQTIAARESLIQAKLDAALARRSELINLAKAKLAELPADARAVVSNVVAQAELPEKEAQRARIAAEIAAKQAELNKLTQ